MKKNIRLGVNIDHVATLRQARGTLYPDPVQAAFIAQDNGADLITVHLREDRRHIQERDVELLKSILQIPLNLEMAATPFMVEYAKKIRPQKCCLVPEKRTELTTEGGLDVVGNLAELKTICAQLAACDIEVSLFIDPDFTQIDAAVACQAPVIELHTGGYADAKNPTVEKHELDRLIKAAAYAQQKGLIVNAGHGLHYHNVQPIAEIPGMHELNIGHSIVAHALMVGFKKAVKQMKKLITA